MSVWGVYCRQEDERPVIAVVRAELTAEPGLTEVLRFPASEHDDRAAQLHAIARAFGTKVKDATPDAVRPKRRPRQLQWSGRT
jgi:hypothetical protein